MNKADRFYDQADEAYRVGSLRLYSKSFAEAPFTVLFGLLFIVLPAWKCQISSLANYLERGELEAYLKKSRELHGR